MEKKKYKVYKDQHGCKAIFSETDWAGGCRYSELSAIWRLYDSFFFEGNAQEALQHARKRELIHEYD